MDFLNGQWKSWQKTEMKDFLRYSKEFRKEFDVGFPLNVCKVNCKIIAVLNWAERHEDLSLA